MEERPMSRVANSENRGFTLVELLAVIAILAVVAALLFPVLHSVKGKARETACASNLHQMSLAMEMYLQDYDEVFPVSYVASRTGPYHSWRQLIGPYVRNTDIFMCPAAEHRGPKAEELPPERRHGYALNAWLSPPDLRAIGGGWGQPVALATVANPTGTIMLCDAGYSNAPVALDLDHYLALGMQEQPLPTERHHGAANFCFADGHVKKMPEAATRSPEYLWDLE